MKNHILSGNRLVLLTLAVLATLILAYVIISSGNHAQAQESVIATPDLTSTTEPGTEEINGGNTIVVEVCTEDPITGRRNLRGHDRTRDHDRGV